MTIGLYMLSMGIGSLLAEGRVVKHVVTSLLKVEILLTITGGFSVIILLVMNSIGAPDIVFFLFAHLLIVLIGVLTGLEIPLLIELRNLEVDGSERSVLGVDYLGAFFGTVVFAFLFYPLVGLIPTAFMVALLNAFVGICLVTQWPKVHEGQRRTTGALLSVQVLLFALLALLLRSADAVNETFLNIYLGL